MAPLRWVAALVGLALVSCDPFFVDAEVAQLCSHQAAQRFEVPADLRAQLEQLAPALRVVKLERTFPLDLQLDLPKDWQGLITTHTRLRSLVLTRAQGSASLGSVDELQVTLLPPEGIGLVPQRFSYHRAEQDPERLAWAFDDFDLTSYLAVEGLQVTLGVAGTLPDTDLIVDIDLCGDAALRLHYL